MKEYGGYIELDTYRLSMLHEGALALNCGRNCLAYLIEANGIKRIKLPYYLCGSVFDVCKKAGVVISLYHIDEHFMPIDISLEDNEWLYFVNYYGQFSHDYIVGLKDKFSRVIVDNSQSYFDEPVNGVDTIYTCRKFFGVADGAFLYTDSFLSRKIPQDESFERMRFLLGRYERTAFEFYNDNVANNRLFKDEPIKSMSKLTNNLLHGIDYEYVKQKRTNNYMLYYDLLNDVNQLDLNPIIGAFSYPLLINEGYRIRKQLQQKMIYIPLLWPNVIESVAKGTYEYQLAMNVLPLPCDQRYGIEDIRYIVDQVLSLH